MPGFFGYSQSAMRLGFSQLRKLTECTSVSIRTNLSFSAWISVCRDSKMTSALLDWLIQHCHILATGNNSYRFRKSSVQPATTSPSKN